MMRFCYEMLIRFDYIRSASLLHESIDRNRAKRCSATALYSGLFHFTSLRFAPFRSVSLVPLRSLRLALLNAKKIRRNLFPAEGWEEGGMMKTN